MNKYIQWPKTDADTSGAFCMEPSHHLANRTFYIYANSVYLFSKGGSVRLDGFTKFLKTFGALGNEFVARYRIRVGEEIGSEALITDGRHARTDALTSLAVVVAGVGAAFGASWVDPAAGLVVAGAIVWLMAKSTRRVFRRVFDGIEPEIVDAVEDTITGVDRVDGMVSAQDQEVIRP